MNTSVNLYGTVRAEAVCSLITPSISVIAIRCGDTSIYLPRMGATNAHEARELARQLIAAADELEAHLAKQIEPQPVPEHGMGGVR